LSLVFVGVRQWTIWLLLSMFLSKMFIISQICSEEDLCPNGTALSVTYFPKGVPILRACILGRVMTDSTFASHEYHRSWHLPCRINATSQPILKRDLPVMSGSTHKCSIIPRFPDRLFYKSHGRLIKFHSRRHPYILKFHLDA
jgi:hypothetical protein